MNTITITETLPATQEKAFLAWTNYMQEWWNPEGFTSTWEPHTVAAGTSAKFTFHGPDGAEYPNVLLFDTIRPHDYIKCHLGNGEADDPTAFWLEVIFKANDQSTEVSMTLTFPSSEMRNQQIEWGVEAGIQGTINRLAAVAAKL